MLFIRTQYLSCPPLTSKTYSISLDVLFVIWRCARLAQGMWHFFSIYLLFFWFFYLCSEPTGHIVTPSLWTYTGHSRDVPDISQKCTRYAQSVYQFILIYIIFYWLTYFYRKTTCHLMFLLCICTMDTSEMCHTSLKSVPNMPKVCTNLI